MSAPATHPTRLDIQPLLDDFVQAMRRLYGRRLSRIILFGSFARGEAHAESDVDLLVLLHDEEIEFFGEVDQLIEATHPLDLAYLRVVSAFPATEQGYQQRTQLVYYNIAEEGQTLYDMQEHIPNLIKRADQNMLDASFLLTEQKSYASSVSRAYYAMFYIGQALLLTERVITKSHSGLANQLGEHLVKPNKLPTAASKLLKQVFIQRQISDYEIITDVSRETAETVLDQASEFCELGKAYLREQGFLPTDAA
jgi:uncharacterized protein (UPF0332 family)/predicted nucleotidyltransferase